MTGAEKGRSLIALAKGIAKRPLEIRKDYAQRGRNLLTSYSSIKIGDSLAKLCQSLR